jgi:hypothetical protein
MQALFLGDRNYPQSTDKIAFICYQFLKLSAFICVNLPEICGLPISQKFMQPISDLMLF